MRSRQSYGAQIHNPALQTNKCQSIHLQIIILDSDGPNICYYKPNYPFFWHQIIPQYVTYSWSTAKNTFFNNLPRWNQKHAWFHMTDSVYLAKRCCIHNQCFHKCYTWLMTISHRVPAYFVFSIKSIESFKFCLFLI